jgi:hypothetical protein
VVAARPIDGQSALYNNNVLFLNGCKNELHTIIQGDVVKRVGSFDYKTITGSMKTIPAYDYGVEATEKEYNDYCNKVDAIPVTNTQTDSTQAVPPSATEKINTDKREDDNDKYLKSLFVVPPVLPSDVHSK